MLDWLFWWGFRELREKMNNKGLSSTLYEFEDTIN